MVVVGVTAIYMLIRLLRPKTWISISAPGKTLRNIGYLINGGSSNLMEMKSANAEIKRPAARVVTDENDRAITWIAYGDLDDDENLNDYRMKGYITKEGYIYKQLLKRDTPVLVGYTARESAPNVPTTKGKRSWTSLWLDSKLNVYVGDPKNTAKDPKERRVGQICLSGISLKKKVITREGQGGVAALFYQKYGPKEETIPVYKEPVYGWNDTALISSIIFSVLFMLLYFTYSIIFQKPLIGDDLIAVFILSACYHAIWAIVRQIKIDSIEKSISIQPQLNMLNKEVGLAKFDMVIIALCLVGFYVTKFFYSYDLYPLLYAITFGVTKNKITSSNKRPWKVISNYDEESNIDDEEELVQPFATITPPEGEMTRTYDWDLDSSTGIKLHGNLVIHFSMVQYNNCKNENPYFSQQIEKPKHDYINDMFNRMIKDPEMTERVRYIASYIKNECSHAKLEEKESIQFALDFVQEPNIDYVLDKNSKSIQFAAEYVRYPDETLFDQEGDSDCKSMLAAMILYFMGYNIVYLSSSKQKHDAIAIELNSNPWMEDNYIDYDADSIITIQRHQYVYCETTGDGYRIGKLVNDMRIEDFETKVELRQSSLEPEEENNYE